MRPTVADLQQMKRDGKKIAASGGRVDPGGDLLLHYWQPAALSEERPPGGAPLPVWLLGEDLVLFPHHQGRPGLLRLHCSHRGAHLSYGRPEERG